MTISRPRRVVRHGSIAASLTLAALIGLGRADLSAQTGTLHIQAARIHDAAATYTLGVRYTSPKSPPALPDPGETVRQAVSEWLFTGMVGGGVSRGLGDITENEATAVGYLGVMYRTGVIVDQVGIIAYGNLNPGGAGPALRLKMAVVDLMIGGLWMEKDLGFRFFLGGGLSWAFIGDLKR